MKKIILTYVLIAAFILGLVLLGKYIIKPDYDNQTKNPYELNLDSIGQIAKEKYGDYHSSIFALPFKTAKALAVDTANNLYVSGDGKMLILSQTGEKKGEFETNKKTATAIAISSDKTIYAAFENQIFTYSADGKILQKGPVFEAESYITSIAIHADLVYMADAALALVYVYKTDGTFVRSIGARDNKDVSTFILPSYYFDVAVAPDGTPWVANTGKHKLVNFGSDGELKTSWGEPSSDVEGFCGCCNPSHFAILEDGSFITAEKGIVRVKKYSAEGKFECAVAGPERFKPGATGLDIAVNSENEILVLEPGAGKIHLFKSKR